MVSLIAACVSYNDALNKVLALRQAGYNEKELAVVNKDQLINRTVHIKPNKAMLNIEFIVMVMLGLTAGVLMGTGHLRLPGMHMGPLGLTMGSILGLAFGLLAALVVSLFTYVVVERLNDFKYRELLTESKFLVFAEGSKEEVEGAERLINGGGLHFELSQ